MFRFIQRVNQIVGQKSKHKMALFFLFFAIGCTVIFLVWFSNALKAPPHMPLTAGHIVGLFIILCLFFVSAFFTLVTLVIAFGKQIKEDSAGTTSTTTLFGFKILQIKASPLVDVITMTPPSIPGDMAWSWIAFDQMRTAPAAENPGVLEAALWNLVALNQMHMKFREETYSLFSNKVHCKPRTTIYLYKSNEPSYAVSGYWENACLRALSSQEVGQSSDLFYLLVGAFGAPAGRPYAEVMKRVEKEYAEKGWGKLSAGFRRDFESNYPHAHLAPQMNAFIKGQRSSYPQLERAITEIVRDAMEDLVDMG